MVFDSVVDKVGIKVGDIIMLLNGKKIDIFFELCVKVVILGVGKIIIFGVLCDGKN